MIDLLFWGASSLVATSIVGLTILALRIARENEDLRDRLRFLEQAELVETYGDESEPTLESR